MEIDWRELECRFSSKYQIVEPSGCWVWVASVDPSGYGIIGSGRKNNLPHLVRAHRLSWMIHFGPIPEGCFVLHRCDVRCCVNPSHLFLGSNADNMADMKKKGRATGASGEANRHSRLTNSQVKEIHKLSKEVSAREIGTIYGIGAAHVRKILRGTRWAVEARHG